MEILVAIIGIIGVVIGSLLDRWHRKFEQKEEYIANAKVVQLMLIKQFNEFENVRKHFSKSMSKENRFWELQSCLISETEWRLSKEDLVHIVGDSNEEITNIIYDIIFVDKKFKDLLLAIDDHHRFREPILQRTLKTGVLNISEGEKEELIRYVEAIDDRINKLDFQPVCEKLHNYLKKKFPKEKFLQYAIKDLNTDQLPK